MEFGKNFPKTQSIWSGEIPTGIYQRIHEKGWGHRGVEKILGFLVLFVIESIISVSGGLSILYFNWSRLHFYENLSSSGVAVGCMYKMLMCWVVLSTVMCPPTLPPYFDFIQFNRKDKNVNIN